ncbi:AMP-binding protein [Derxia gummosa]|uniref:AMP-binding protein n=1 Tax=Derxia gummosa DSM 723 TaxID=1121388 RepID=A0A8B6XC30_9BURK|nr:AMP-binding protein [Derxia gummosa]
MELSTEAAAPARARETPAADATPVPPAPAAAPNTGALDRLQHAARANPAAFWAERAAAIDWLRPWDAALDASRAPFNRWFPGGQLNTCFNALDRHVLAGHGARTALIHDSAYDGRATRVSYAELLARTARFAGVLRDLGVGRGDRVVIYMPMVVEAVVAMLACARLGAVHSVVFGGFAAPELATRIDDCTPKAVVTASCGIEPGRVVEYKPLLDAALARARHAVPAVVVLQRPQCAAAMTPGRDHDWQALDARATPADCVPVEATDPLYILYTSGTTGQPKGIVRDNGGHAVALLWSVKAVYDIDPGDVFWAASDIGWQVGHSYITYGPLLAGATALLYEGKPVGTPDAGAFWRVLREHRVKVLLTAPTAIRAIRREDPDGALLRGLDLPDFRALFLAGERSDADTLRWAETHLRVPVVDHWWQTETGWPIAADPLGIERLPVKHGSPTRAVPGWDIHALDADGREVAPGETGLLAVRLPLPPGAATTIWNADERFERAYFRDLPGWYKTGDAGCIDADGYIFVMSRVDDVINVAGHRLSTGAIEEVLAAHPDVAECAVIGMADALKGQVPVGFVVLKKGVARAHAAVAAEVVAAVRDRIGPVAAFRQALVVERLPKTRSGKILRATMAGIADGKEVAVPATIEDAGVLEEIRVATRALVAG